MKRMQTMYLTLAGLLLATPTTLASDAETSASATGGRGRAGTSAASARYDGDIGFARTDTRSGRVNLARGIAVGVDEDGLSLSLSTAVASQRGPALATNVNISVGRDGRTSSSVGTAVARGGRERSVSVGGSTTTRPGRATISHATGRTLGGGSVRAQTTSTSSTLKVKKVIRKQIRRIVVRRR